MEKLNAKQQAEIRNAMYANLIQCLEVMNLEAVQVTEGLVVKTAKCDMVIKVIIKKEEVDVEEQLAEIAQKAKEKAEKTAKAEAKKAKDEAKRAKAKADKAEAKKGEGE